MRLGRAFVGLVVVGALVYATQHGSAPIKSAGSVTVATFDPQKAFDDGRALEELWRKVKAKTGAEAPDPSYVDKIDRALGEIPLDWPKSEEAIAIIKRLRTERPAIEKAYEAGLKAYSAKIAAENEKKLLGTRKNYASKMETIFLDGGKDVYVNTEGKDYRTVRIKYILMSRPLVHQLSKSDSVVSGWREAGFHKVILTDGYNATWTLDLK